MSDALTATDSTGTAAYARVLGIEGANQAGAGLVLFPVFQLGQVPVLYKPTGLLTLSETRAGVIASTSPASVIWTPQTFDMLGYTRVPGTTPEIAYLVQRQGLGQMFVTPSAYRGEVADATAMVALSLAVVGDWCQRSDQGHGVYQLTAAPYSTAGNWTARTGANRPNIFFGAVADEAAMVALSTAIVGDWCTRTDASAAVYQLSVAPYSTAANWLLRNDVDAPTIPMVKIHWNNLDPQFLPAFHPPVMLTTCGIGNNEWVAS